MLQCVRQVLAHHDASRRYNYSSPIGQERTLASPPPTRIYEYTPQPRRFTPPATLRYAGGMSSHPAIVPQFFASCSAPRSDTAKIVKVGLAPASVGKMHGPAIHRLATSWVWP